MIIDISVVLILCIFSAFGFCKGFLKCLFFVFVALLSIYLSYLLLPVILEWLSPLLDNINMSVWGFDDEINLLFNSNNKVCILIKILLHLINFNNISLKMLVFNTAIFVVILMIIKKIIKVVTQKLYTKIKDVSYIGRPDKLLGTAVGLLIGVFVCSVICFIVVGLNSSGVFGLVLDNQINSSALVYVFDSGFDNLVSAMYNIA